MSFAFSTLKSLLYVFISLIHLKPSQTYPEFSPGEVSPERLEIGIGSSANITCRMNLTMFNGSNSSSLHFIESDTKKRVPENDITLINASTIVYTMRNAVEQDRRYICMSDDMGIAEAHVIVGTPPTEVTEFQCRGFNYIYMVCNFTIPHNTLDVKYDLNFYWTSPQYKQICDLEKIAGGEFAICNITKSSGKYHQHYEIYNFTLSGSNSLGSRNQSFVVNNFESVIPPRPELTLLESTNNSAKFGWRMETYFYIEKGLKYEIRLRPNKFNWIDNIDYRVRRKRTGYTIELNNLPYAFYNYTISLRIRVNSPDNDENLWSETELFRFQTSPCLPDAPPKTDVSSFDLIDSTESRVRLYWEQRPFYRENGPNFQYILTETFIDDIQVEMSPVYMNRTSAVFPWDRKHKYEFVIRSYNNIGYSLDSSRIVIPSMGSKRLMDYTPDWIRSIYRESNRTFTLSWNPPFNQSNLFDYTVFWCNSKPAVSNECNDTIQFKHISKRTTQFTTEAQHEEQKVIFAVSANYIDFTTGLHWTMCTADIAIDLIKMDPEFTVVSSREISVQWNLIHVCASILEGYNLTICPIEDSQSERCERNKAITLTIEKNAKSFVLTNLKPYTTYKAEMYMFSKLKRGKTSDPHILTTHEEAPSPPRHLKYHNITSDSVLLSWLPPLETNGVLRSYTVVYCAKHGKLLCQNVANITKLNYELKLSSYTDYTVYVLANTTQVSQPSNEVHLKTLVGIPSRPHHLTTFDKNDTILQWTQQSLISERVDFYEVSIEFLFQGQKVEEQIFGVINATSCAINIPPCLNKGHKRLLRVRAVTAAARSMEIDEKLLTENNYTNENPKAVYFTDDNVLKCYNNEASESEQLAQWKRFHQADKYVLYKSKWQEGITYGCAAPKEFFMVFLYVGVFTVLIACILLCRVSYKRYKSMADIQARLPPGLDYIGKDNNGGVRGNVNDRIDEFYIRSKEATNEQKRLLTMDSGYIGECSDIGVSTPPISIGTSSSGYNGSNPSMDYHQAIEFNSKNSNSNPMDDVYMLMQIPKYNAQIQMRQQNPLPTTHFDEKRNSLSKVPEGVVTTSLAPGAAINPYSMSTISSSGYVETRASQKHVNPASCVTYTTPEALSRKTPAQPPSGYVTPKELLAMGQHSFR